jgi:serine O-acetyltransferase
MDKIFLDRLFRAHQACPACPSLAEVAAFFTQLLGTLYAEFAEPSFISIADLEKHLYGLKAELEQILRHDLKKGNDHATLVASRFFEALPILYDKINQDITAMYEGDPAAKSRNEVIRTYPGFYAIAAYRVAHELHSMGVREVPRIITEHAHSKTGIDIHPSAEIGRGFFIDHGTGVVIGATAIIGENVRLYQAVTLGAKRFVTGSDGNLVKGEPRHPIIEDNVVIYAGATILGRITVGRDSVIGGNVWLTQSVPPGSVITQARTRLEENDAKPSL